LIFLVGQALSWEGGSFEFILLDPAHEEFRKAFSFPLFPSLEEGVNAQFLAMEAVRIQDEMSQSQPILRVNPLEREGRGSLPLSAPAPVEKEKVAKQILLVDDQEEIIEATGGYLRQHGYRVAVAHTVDTALEVIERSEEGGWVVLADLVMPKRDRSGLLGGLEVAEMLHNHPRVTRIFLAADSLYPNLEERSRLFGIEGVVLKPPRREWIQNLKGAASTYGERIVQVVGPPLPKETQTLSGNESLELELGMEELDPDNPLRALFSQENLVPIPKPRTSQGVELLRQMVEELITPEGETEVSLLILRFASHLFQRVILFVVTKKELRGLGQVGLSGEGAGKVIRELRIPLGKGTIFDQVVEERRLFAGKPPAQPLLHRLLTRLGGPVPFEIVLAPIAVQGRVVALLYGDQVPTQAPLRDLEVLEVFLAQAGLALERAYLRRQLLQKNRKGGA
jgi:CheY-like chemotaxis protein